MNPKLLNLPTECEYSPISVTLFQSQENSWKIEFSENHLWLWASTVWLTCTAQECGYAPFCSFTPATDGSEAITGQVL
jgi:hypothetical protein